MLTYLHINKDYYYGINRLGTEGRVTAFDLHYVPSIILLYRTTYSSHENNISFIVNTYLYPNH